MKVINTSAGSSASSTTTTTLQGVRVAKGHEPLRKVETLCKQEKANRIVAEAIARAKARGERNIPRVLNHDELPDGQTVDLEGGANPAGVKKAVTGNKKKSHLGAATTKSVLEEKKAKLKCVGAVVAGGGSKSKSKAKSK